MLIAVMVHEENIGGGKIPTGWKSVEQSIMQFERDVNNYMDAARLRMEFFGPKKVTSILAK
jgi:hypothetical protein